MPTTANFPNLSRQGQTRRLREVAVRALDRYSIRVRQMTLLAEAWNTLLSNPCRRRAPLRPRINRPDVRTWLQIHSELTWMDAIHRDTDVTIPVPISARDGTMIQTIKAPGVPERRDCVLFTWVRGRTASTEATPRTVALLGEAITLHDHADHFYPSEPFSDTTAQNVWPSGRPEAIYGDTGHPSITPTQRLLIQEMATRVQTRAG